LSREVVALGDRRKNPRDERIPAGRPTKRFSVKKDVRAGWLGSRTDAKTVISRTGFYSQSESAEFVIPQQDLLQPTNLPFIFITQKRCLSRA